MRFLYVITILSLLSCNSAENEDFEAHSDCLVYNNEIVTESYDFGKVAYIDTTMNNGCTS